ncbi:Transcription initiation factor TFIID subunit 9B [Podila humilis]|nr:Transcription initiation factor TFIID subunit 9B [Podila humilis]
MLVISLILQSLSVEDAEHKVIHQLLEFAHSYTTDVFQDALLYSEHAGRTDVGLDDVKLAIQGRVNHSFTSPPPKEFLLELAEEKNKVPLPLIPEKYGIRLPQERHCLTAINFQLIPELPPRGTILKDTIASGGSSSGLLGPSAVFSASASTPVDASDTAATTTSAAAAPSLFKVKEADNDEEDSDEDMKDASRQEQPLTQSQQNLANHDAWKRKRADDEENYDD